MKFTSLCYNNGMTKFAMRILERLAGTNLEGNISELDSEKLRIGFQFLKQKWKSTREVDSRDKLFLNLSNFSEAVFAKKNEDELNA